MSSDPELIRGVQPRGLMPRSLGKVANCPPLILRMLLQSNLREREAAAVVAVRRAFENLPPFSRGVYRYIIYTSFRDC